MSSIVQFSNKKDTLRGKISGIILHKLKPDELVVNQDGIKFKDELFTLDEVEDFSIKNALNFYPINVVKVKFTSGRSLTVQGNVVRTPKRNADVQDFYKSLCEVKNQPTKAFVLNYYKDTLESWYVTSIVFMLFGFLPMLAYWFYKERNRDPSKIYWSITIIIIYFLILIVALPYLLN
ncbi:MAG: hypothetical protein HeimC3_33710 [Candidatus Heimdallarchaeota archaeon LC_3]|nr:MAG: hypothetical protein HeimC3_33710 [Candidatus Heimdallarchaeota archaeon LC_3]